MTEKSVLPWVSVNDSIDNEFRQQLVEDALSHFQRSSPELRKTALETLKKIQVNGFRPFPHIRLNKFITHLVPEFESNNAVTTIIISLWAETHSAIIKEISEAARKANIFIPPSWSWQKAKQGYVNIDAIPELDLLIQDLISNKTKLEKDQYRLAALCLGSSVSTAETEAFSLKEDETDPAASPAAVVDIDEPVEVTNPNGPNAPESPQCDCVETTSPTSSNAQVSTFDATEWDGKALKNLSEYWRLKSNQGAEYRAAILAKIDQLRECVLDNPGSGALEKSRQIEAQLIQWDVSIKSSKELSGYMRSRLTRELQLRPGMEDLVFELNNLNSDVMFDDLITIYLETIQAIEDFDKKKHDYLFELNNLRNELLTLEQSLSLWQSDVVPIRNQLKQLNDVRDYSIGQLQNMVENSRKLVQEGKTKRLQARGISIGRILDSAKKIIDLSKGQTVQIGKYELLELNEVLLQALAGKELQEFERQSLALLNQFVAKKRAGNSQKIAVQLKAIWNEATLEQLLGHLANEKKDVEAMLMEMASNAVHPRATQAVYSREIARSLFGGISELSTDTNPYILLNQLANQLFLGWTGSDPVTRYERCILALAAQSASATGLSEGFLWQIELDWPEPSLKSWGRLWQSVLLDEDIQIYTDQKVEAMQAALNEKEKSLALLFARDGRHYMRLSGVKSDLHRSMMTNRIMPEFQQHYTGLSRLRKQLENALLLDHPKLLTKLTKTRETLEKSLTEKNLTELYKKGIYEAGIDDDQPLHIRACMRIISEIAITILEYGRMVQELEMLRNTRRDSIDFQSLADEISKIADTSSLIKQALDQITKGSPKPGLERNEEEERLGGIQTIVEKLLSDPSYVHRFPHTIGVFVNHPFHWDALLQSLIDDISAPQDTQSAATLLLEKCASDQILLVVQQLPLDIQKRAQAIHRQQERRINELEDEFIKLGGDSEWIKVHHDLGRWGYLFTRLSEEIENLKRKTEADHQAFEQQSFEFRERINKLDMELFKERLNIPVEAFRILQDGLSVARKASEVAQLFPQLKEYLDEIDYRLSRESWIEAEMESAKQELEKQLLGIRGERGADLSVEQILDAFNAGKLGTLGLEANELEESKISTRVNLLDNWLAVKRLRTVSSAKLNRLEINNIKSLFSYFARMNQMQHSLEVNGDYMSYDNPIVHEYWELRHPRTPALTKQCIMIALPGDPPSADDLQNLDEFLEKEKFLVVHFVFLFVPGCNHKIAKRLNQNYSKQGLVLIDEEALLSMILAERESSIVPLGKLRPMMLNSTGANADIFTVNQSVNSRTSIFFGREQLVDRIASSGSNYAIYGGRRIGKSSVLKALEQLLEDRKERVISYSLEGDTEYSEEYVSRRLASLMHIQHEYEESKDIKNALFNYFETHPDESIVLILDEIDRYISGNRSRHTLIEALRATSDHFEHRFRVIIAGFMGLYDCLSGRGPYTPTSDPWGRMLNNMGPLENLKPSDAEKIVQEGFRSILGWNFENRAIPRRIVERTGGHPAFVQYFCLKLQEQVSKRGDQLIMLKDIDTVFNDDTPEKSFIWFVRKTLEMNLSDLAYKRKSNSENISDPVSRYLLLWLALDSSTSKTFTLDQIHEMVNLSRIHIPEKILMRSLELLTVTSVVREKSSQLYEFTVPDYPLILNRLVGSSQLEALENELRAFLERFEDDGQE